MSNMLASYAQINPRLTPSDVLVFELSDPRFAGTTFIATDSYCVQPSCPCRLVSLQLERLPESPTQRDPNPMRCFLHLDTLELQDTAGRPLEIARYPLAEALMAEMPDDAVALWRKHYEEGRVYGLQNAWRYRKWDELEPGDMLSFADVWDDTPIWTLELEGARYAAIDRYCPSPTCDCREALVSIIGPLEEGNNEDAPEALLRIGLNGEVAIEDDGGVPTARLNRLGQDLAGRGGRLKELKERYRRMKEVGHVLAVRHPLLAAAWGVKVEKPATAPAGTTGGPRVGRNEACPCGSGKKYKQCCGKN